MTEEKKQVPESKTRRELISGFVKLQNLTKNIKYITIINFILILILIFCYFLGLYRWAAGCIIILFAYRPITAAIVVQGVVGLIGMFGDKKWRENGVMWPLLAIILSILYLGILPKFFFMQCGIITKS